MDDQENSVLQARDSGKAAGIRFLRRLRTGMRDATFPDGAFPPHQLFVEREPG